MDLAFLARRTYVTYNLTEVLSFLLLVIDLNSSLCGKNAHQIFGMRAEM